MLSSTLEPSKLPKHLPCPRQITKNSTMLQPNTQIHHHLFKLQGIQ